MKRYLLSFIGAVLLHLLLLMLIPSGSKLVEVEVDDNTPLLEMEFYEEEPEAPAEIVEPQAEQAYENEVQEEPEEQEPIEEPLEEVEEVLEDVIAEEVVEKPVEEPQPRSEPKPVTNKVVVKSSSASSSTVVNSSELDAKNFKPFGNKKPKYPSIARKANIEGWVKVRVLVNNRGKAEKVEVLDFQGHPSFKKATIDVAYTWRFPIPTRRGKRVKTWYKKKVAFRLRD